MKIKILLSLLCVIAFKAVAASTLYKLTDKEGHVTFTDVKPDTGVVEALEVAPIQTIGADTAAIQPLERKVVTKKEGVEKYSLFKIDAPQDKTIFHNTDSIPIHFKVTPPLSSAHTIRIIANDKVVFAKTSDVSPVLKLSERGLYHVKAEILDEFQRVLKTSNTVELSIYKHSKLFKQSAVKEQTAHNKMPV